MGHYSKALDLLTMTDSLATKIALIPRRNELVSRINALRQSELFRSVDVEPINGTLQADHLDNGPPD